MSKRRFPGDDDSDESSSEDDNGGNYGRSNVITGSYQYGGGKQFRPSGGKQLRPAQESESESESESDEEPPQQQSYNNYSYQAPRYGGGKQFRPSGGKQLRPIQSESEDDASEEEEEEEPPAPPPISVRPYRGGGKQLMSMGHMRTQPSQRSDDESSSSEEETAPTTTVVQPRYMGGGKSFRPPPQKDETSESEEESEEESGSEYESGDDQIQQPHPQQPPDPPPVVPKDEEEEEEDDDKDHDEEDNENEDMETSDNDNESVVEKKEKEEEEKKPELKKEVDTPLVKPTSDANEIASKDDEESVEDVDMESNSGDSSDGESSEEELDIGTLDPSSLVKGEKDKKYLDSLTELEREDILARRFEERKAKAEMKLALKASKRQDLANKESGKSKSKKNKTMDITDKSGKSADESSDNEKVTADEDGKTASSRKRALSDDDSDESLDFGDDDNEEELEDDSDDDKANPWGRSKSSSKPDFSLDEDDDDYGAGRDPYTGGDIVEADYEDIAKLTLPRRRLARWCNEPFFKSAVMDCYVRLGAGVNKKTGKRLYKLYLICGVESKMAHYSFPKMEGNKKAISTNKFLKVKHNKQTTSIRMLLASETRPSQDEVSHYMNQLKNTRSNSILSKKRATKLFKDQQDLVNNYNYTREDIDRQVEEKKRQNKNLNIGKELTRINMAVQAAKNELEEAMHQLEVTNNQLNKQDLTSQEEDKLFKLRTEQEVYVNESQAIYESKQAEEKRLLDLDENLKKRLRNTRSKHNLSRVNQRALVANQRADYDAYKQQKAKETEQALDPYARRKVKPKNLWEVGQGNDEKETKSTVKDTPKKKAKPIDDKAKVKDDAAEKEKKKAEIAATQMTSMDQSHQFAIDDELLGKSSNKLFGMNMQQSKPRRIRRGLSLAEYQARKLAGTL